MWKTWKSKPNFPLIKNLGIEIAKFAKVTTTYNMILHVKDKEFQNIITKGDARNIIEDMPFYTLGGDVMIRDEKCNLRLAYVANFGLQTSNFSKVEKRYNMIILVNNKRFQNIMIEDMVGISFKINGLEMPILLGINYIFYLRLY